jgi:Zn-finger nucleic acid-binding protein
MDPDAIGITERLLVECPKCKAPMFVVEYEKVEIDHCAQCAGTWFDRGELALLLEDLNPEAVGLLPTQIVALPAADVREEARKCPICRKKMRKVFIGPKHDILIDACPLGDGLWFDDLEAAELAQQIVDTDAVASDRAVVFLGRVFRKREASPKVEGEKA